VKLTLNRHSFLPEGIFGTLELPGGLALHTLEHSYGLTPKLPAGSYVCKRGTHRLSCGKPFETFEVMGVPGHTGILFHAGNLERDSSGCILLGMEDSGDKLLRSRLAVQAFMQALSGQDSFQLQVIDHRGEVSA
jgi:hypothetical protein